METPLTFLWGSRSRIPSVKRDKRRPKTSAKKTILVVLMLVVAALIGFAIYAQATTVGPPSPCSHLNTSQQAQLANLYSSYPTVNSSATVKSFVCDNPDFNFGEWTNPSVEKALGGNGWVEIHSLSYAQTTSTLNRQPGAFLFVAITHIHNSTAQVYSTWLDTDVPDPSFQQIAAGLGVTV